MVRQIWLVVIVLATAASAQHLPRTAVPQHYQLTFTPHFENDTFSGDEIIDIRILQPAPMLTLNAAEIEFQEVRISSGVVTQTAQVVAEAQKEMVTVTVPKPLAAGPAKIHIRYTGHLNDQMRGFYLSTDSGRKYAITQFEATDARRAYPSFDEPAYKATFDIAAVIPKRDVAISNGRVVSDIAGPGEDVHTVKFATTPKMSSYLVALAVGDFKCLEGSADGIPIRVCGTPEKYKLGQFALDAAQQVMRFYNRYFAIKYPYGKLDIIGVADFSAGAMENTACIISRDQLLFADQQHSTPRQLRDIAVDAIAHEMAHQWFGDLVTMEWWNDSWLNEGFATWMAYKPVEQWKPEWKLLEDKVVATASAMSEDSLQATHPVKVEVETPAEINEIFDSIIYEKAAAMLDMVEGYAGSEAFRTGVNAYLKKYAYSNASAQDFWNTIAQVSKKPVDRILSSFVVQPGVPLVSFRAACEQSNKQVAVSQTRYTYDRQRLEAGSPELWMIPICAKAGSEKCELLTSRAASLMLPGCAPVYGNAGARGYYRTAYDADEFRKLAASAEAALTSPERIMFVNDAWAAVRVDREDIGGFLALAEGLRNDRSQSLTRLLNGDLRYVGDYLVTSEDAEKYRSWLRNLLEPTMQEIGWSPGAAESQELRSLRGEILTTLGVTARDPRAISEARAIVDKDLRGEPVDPILVAPALEIAGRNGDPSLFDAIMARVKNPRSPEDHLRYLLALTNFTQPELLRRTLEFGLSPQVRNQDAVYVFGGTLQNPGARTQAWDFIRQHWPEVEAKVTDNNVDFVVRAVGTFCDPESRDQVRAFASEHKVPSAERTFKQSLERINYCIDLKNQQASKLGAWLAHGDRMQAGE